VIETSSKNTFHLNFVRERFQEKKQYLPLQRTSNVHGQSGCQIRHCAVDRDQGFYGCSPCPAADQFH